MFSSYSYWNHVRQSTKKVLSNLHWIETALVTTKAPNVNKSIQKVIYNANSSTEILNICNLKQNEIYHSSIYGKALQQCINIKCNNENENIIINNAISIMNIMLYQ
eukprot:167190_1